jgi:hypothetical protein
VPQISIKAMVSTLRLYGPGKWKLKKRFRKGIFVKMDKIEVQIPVFDTEPKLGRISGYGIKISKKIIVERDKIGISKHSRVPREHLGCVWKLKRYSGSRKTTKKRDYSNCGFGTTRFEVGS